MVWDCKLMETLCISGSLKRSRCPFDKVDFVLYRELPICDFKTKLRIQTKPLRGGKYVDVLGGQLLQQCVDHARGYSASAMRGVGPYIGYICALGAI